MKKTIEAMMGDIDHHLVAVLLELVRDGPQDVQWLTARARRRLKDPRVDEYAVSRAIETCTLLLGRPDGSVTNLVDALDGQVLTHRVTGTSPGRTDLWSILALLPLIACASRRPLRLASGGEVAPAAFGHSALVGPPGWLPDAAPGQLLGLRLGGGLLSVEVHDQNVVSDDRDALVRQVLTTHYRTEEWFAADELQARPGALNRAIGYGLLEHPNLLAEPVTPLNELLYDALHEVDRVNQFRDQRAWEAGDCVTFGISGMPEALSHELSRRAARYDMSLDQYVILALGHLAWRTPFAEDLGPWESWDLEPPGQTAPPARLPVASSAGVGAQK